MATKYIQDKNGNYYTDENGNLITVDAGTDITNDMPIIRLVAVSDLNRTGIISPTNPVRITIEVVSGTIRETDVIQICSKKAMTYKKYDTAEDSRRKRGRRWRLRRFMEQPVSLCHPVGTIPRTYVMWGWNPEQNDPNGKAREFLRSDNVYEKRGLVTKYVRVARLTDRYYHSNAIPILFTVGELTDEKTTAKINVL